MTIKNFLEVYSPNRMFRKLWLSVPELLQQSDIYVSTSLFEGTSNSIMEALNWSLPVICTNVGDNNHLVLEGKNGFLTEIGDAENLADSIITLLDNFELRNTMGKAVNKHLKNNFSMEIFTEKYNRLIK